VHFKFNLRHYDKGLPRGGVNMKSIVGEGGGAGLNRTSSRDANVFVSPTNFFEMGMDSVQVPYLEEDETNSKVRWAINRRLLILHYWSKHRPITIDKSITKYWSVKPKHFILPFFRRYSKAKKKYVKQEVHHATVGLCTS
jgi:hypothetical protein